MFNQNKQSLEDYCVLFKMFEKLSKKPIAIAIIIAGFLIVVIGGTLFYNKINKGKVEKIAKFLTAQQASEKTIDFINKNLVQPGMTVTSTNVTEESGLYKITFKAGEQQYDSYVTKDGKFLFFQGINMEENFEATTPEEQSSTQGQSTQEEEKFTDEQLESLAKCLSEKGAKFYGASWCGWCKKQKEAFGKAVSYLPYVECIDEKTQEMTSQCKEAEISGFPTWEINGEKYTGFKKIRELAEISKCSL